MNWRVISAIVRKDILDVFKNSQMLFALFLPIGTLLLFNPVFNSGTSEGIIIVVIDHGNSSFVQLLDEIPGVELIAVDTFEELQTQVQADAAGGLVLSKHFDVDIQSGEQPNLMIYTNRQRDGVGAANFQRLIEGQLHISPGTNRPWTSKPWIYPQVSKTYHSICQIIC